MRVLVTGHHGYIGAVLVRMLTAAGYDVVGLDSDFFVQNRFVGKVVETPSLRKDLRDIEPDDFRRIDAVLHLAALSNDPLGDLNPELTYEINYRDSMELPSLADSNFSPVFLRNTTAYGVSPFMRFDVVLNNLVAWTYTTGRVLIQSDGTPWRPLIHVEDICRAFIAVLEAPREAIHNQAFNVGITEENYQVRDLAAVVQEVVPGCKIEYSANGGPDPRSYRVNFSKIKNTIPGFQPEWNIRRGAEEVYAACGEIKLTLEEFEGPHFKRITHIQRLLGDGQLDSQLRWMSVRPIAAPAASPV